MTNKKMWKFLKGMKSANGDHRWAKGKWYRIDGELDICVHGFHASAFIPDALGFVQGDTLACVEVRGEHIDQSNKSCYREMRVVKTWKWTKMHSVKLAIFAAELCIEDYESKYPDDSRPRQAIEATKAWLKNPSGSAESAARIAESAASAARSVARSAARSAASAESAAMTTLHKFVLKMLKVKP